MLKIGVSLIILSGSFSLSAQTVEHPGGQPRVRQPQVDVMQRQEGAFSRLRTVADRSRMPKPLSKETLRAVKDLYRKPTSDELKKLQPLPEDLQKYAAFLKGHGTGILRLEPYKACEDSMAVLDVSADCLEYSMPGNGSDYSFRERSYRSGRLADLRYGGISFSSPGRLQQAIFVGVGDIPLEKVSLTTPGVPFISEMKPEEQTAKAIDVGLSFRDGREKDGYFYASALRAVENMTYVLRSVAYRGVIARALGGAVYNELDFDERADVTVAFRIIRKHEAGGVTILWKELDRRRSPRLLREKLPAPAPNQFARARR